MGYLDGTETYVADGVPKASRRCLSHTFRANWRLAKEALWFSWALAQIQRLFVLFVAVEQLLAHRQVVRQGILRQPIGAVAADRSA